MVLRRPRSTLLTQGADEPYDPTRPLDEQLAEISNADLAAWVWGNGPNLPPDVAVELAALIDERGDIDAQGTPVGDAYQTLVTHHPDVITPETEDGTADFRQMTPGAALEYLDEHPEVMGDELQELLDTATARTGEDSSWNLVTNEIQGRSDNISTSASESSGNAVREEATDEALEAYVQEKINEGIPETVARRMGEELLGGVIGDSETPRWMLEMFMGEPTPEQQQRLVDYFNDALGESFFDYKSLVASGSLKDPSEMNQQLAEGAMLSSEPILSYGITIPGMREQVQVSAEEAEAFREAGFGMDAVTGLYRRAHAFTGIDPTTGQNRPVDIAGLAMMARYFGWGNLLTARTARDQRIEQLKTQINALKAQEKQMGPAASGIAAPLLRELKELQAQQNEGQEQLTHFQQRERAALGKEGGFDRAFRTESVGGQVAKQVAYNRGLDMYGQNQTLAFIHAVDTGLAARIAATGGDPAKMSNVDSERAVQVLMEAGVINRSNTWAGKLGLRSGDSVLRQFGDYFAATAGGGDGGGGGGGSTRRVVDPVAVKEQVTRLWQAFFRGQPTDEVVSAFTNSLQQQLDSAPEGMDFDVSSRIQEWLKGQAVYDELYKNKPSGVSEEEYQGQFAAAQASILGNELTDDGAILDGMRTGSYQTTVGAAAASKQALENSTWLERLARAGQIVAENT